MPSGSCAELIAVLAAAAALAAQAPRGGIVEGRVTNRVNGEPVRRAVAGLRSAGIPPGDVYLAPVDANGRFRIEGVPPGSYRAFAQAEHFSYLSAGAPAATPPIEVAEGQRVAGIHFQMTPLGVISGRALDADGDPVSNVAVEAAQYRYVQGRRQLGSGRRATTDDRGQYRLFDLPPGRYYVRASRERVFSESSARAPVRGPRLPEGFALTYYPNARDPAETAPVEVAPGAEVRGIDIRLVPAVFHSIRGTVAGLGDPETRPMLRIQRRTSDSSAPLSGFSLTTTSRDEFEFRNLLPGSYVIIAERRQGERAVARQVVDVVDADVEGVHLTLSPGIEVRGVVRATGPLKQPIAGRQIMLSSTNSGMFGNAATEIKPDGSFAFRSVLPDVYRLQLPQTPGAYLKSLRIGELEVQGQEIDLKRGSAGVTVLLGTDVGRLEGQVVDAGGAPLAGAFVTLPSLTRGGGIRTAMADAKGAFKIEDVPPGNYRLFAWQDAEPGAPIDPEFRKPYIKQAVTVRVEPNSSQTVKVTAISVK